MRRLTAITAVAALASVLGGAAPALAAPVFSYFVPQASYTIDAGTTVSVPVYLQEIAAPDDSDSLLASHDGLATAGVEVSQSSNPLVTISTVAANLSVDATAFDPPAGISSLPSTDVTLGLSDDFSRADGTNAPPTNGIRQILLGTFTFSADPAASGPVIFSIADPSSTPDTTLFSDGTVLDSQIAGTTVTINVTATPEPATLAVLALPALFLLKRRRA
ncbi:MAG TPA: hypothetical protein VHQ47_09805 [Phycisphaerae bacterium]|nr:hypothetical protein [Phycisphaerae bacterium]